MRKFLLLFAIVFLTLGASAQLQVKENSFKAIPGFVNNHAKYQTDDNEEPFSVIVVKLSNITEKQARQLLFEGDMRTYFEIEYKKDELWLYTSWYASFIKISHPDLSSFEFTIPFDMEKGKGYEMVLENKASTLNEGYASISVITYPDGAYISLNGTVMSSVTPYKNPRIHSGTYTITVSKEFYQTVTQEITISANENRIVEITMPIDAANIIFKADENTKVFVDNELLATGGWTGMLTAGVYTVRYEKSGYKPATKTIVVKPGEDAVYELNPTKLVGEANVTSNPSKTKIYIDGKKVGKAPMVVKDLSVGSHNIRLQKRKHIDYVSTFTIRENQTSNVYGSLYRKTPVKDAMGNATSAMGDFFRGVGDVFSDIGDFLFDDESYEKGYFVFEVTQNQFNNFSYGFSAGVNFFESCGTFISMDFRGLLKDVGVSSNGKEICDEDFTVGGYTPLYDGTSLYQKAAMRLGLIFFKDSSVSLRLGIGYGSSRVYYKTNEMVEKQSSSSSSTSTSTTKMVNVYIRSEQYSYTGFDFSVGLQYYMHGILMKTDVVCNMKGWFALSYGFGLGW